MKTVLAFVLAACATGSVMASDDMNLCEVNLQKLRDLRASIAVVPQPLLGEVQHLRMDAQDAKDNNDPKKCVGYTLKALQKLRTAGKS